jgi:membrane associated rhomboid family serine protease
MAMNLLLDISDGAPAAALLLSVMVAVSLVGLYLQPAWLERHLLRPYGLLARRQFLSLISSGFLHADLPHLLFNAFTFWAFAFALERTIGTARFVALYAVGLLVSSVSTWVRHRRNPDYRSLGASGAILAVLFASIVYTPTQSIMILPIPVPIPAPLFAVCYLAYTWIASRQTQGRINHDAHLAGAVAGLFFVLLTDAGAFRQAVSQWLA